MRPRWKVYRAKLHRDGSANVCPVRRGDIDVDVLVILVLLGVLVLLNPAETSKVDGRKLNLSLVEEFNNLATNVSLQTRIAALREGHEPYNE